MIGFIFGLRKISTAWSMIQGKGSELFAKDGSDVTITLGRRVAALGLLGGFLGEVVVDVRVGDELQDVIVATVGSLSHVLDFRVVFVEPGVVQGVLDGQAFLLVLV